MTVTLESAREAFRDQLLDAGLLVRTQVDGLYGRSGVWRGRPVYVEAQLARLKRQDLADETRLDATLGVTPARNWLLLAQTFAGEADRTPVSARWVKGELSAVRVFGDWSVQAGWRTTLAGRDIARDQGVVLAVWRRL